MTTQKGKVLGLVADEIGVDVGMVADVFRHVHQFNQGYAEFDIDPKAVAMLLVGLAVKSLGCSSMKAGNIARDEANGFSGEMLEAMRAGTDYCVNYAPPVKGLVAGATVSGVTLRNILYGLKSLERSGFCNGDRCPELIVQPPTDTDHRRP